MSDLLSEKRSISSGFFRNVDDTISYSGVEGDSQIVSKKAKDEGRVKKFERSSSKNRDSMSLVQDDITRKFDSLLENSKRNPSAGSLTSKDEGISSTGEKEEDDINEEEETAETDDEGRGSWMGDKNRDDLLDVEGGLPAVTEEHAINEALESYEASRDVAVQNFQKSLEETENKNSFNVEEMEQEVSSYLQNSEDAGESAYNGDVEDTPSQSMADKDFFSSQLKEIPEQKEQSNDYTAEVITETVSEETQVAKEKKRKKKKRTHGIIDLDRITANRVPISIRTTPLPVPISGKKENVNFKPRFKSKVELQRIKKLKQKAKKKRNETPVDPSNEESAPDEAANELIAATNEAEVVIKYDETIGAEDSQGQKGGDFVNPLMDHSLKRPVAPHQRNRPKTTENEVPKNMEVTDPNTEVWVPGDDKLYVYSYSSAPRLLHVKRLGSKRVATTAINDTDPNSSFRIKSRNGRVIRGTNFGKDGAPKWNPYFAYARSLSQNDYSFYETDEIRQRREEFRKRMKEKARVRRDTLGFPSVYQTPSGLNTGHQASVRRSSKFQPVSKNLKSRTLDSSISPEEAIIKALVANTLREAAVEVSAEAEVDAAKMEKLAARRLSTMGEESSPSSPKESSKEDSKEYGGKGTEPPEEDVRGDPEGKETSPDEDEAPFTLEDKRD